MTEQPIVDLAHRLRACLDDDNPDQALITLTLEPNLLVKLPLVKEERYSVQHHPLIGLATTLMATALIRNGKAEDARKFIEDTADLFPQEQGYYCAGSSNLNDFIIEFPCVWIPRISAFIAVRDWLEAMWACTNFASLMRHSNGRLFPADFIGADLLTHPRIGVYGPFRFSRDWLLDRQLEIINAGPLDRTLEEVYRFEELFICNALLTGQAERALPLIESRGEAYEPASDTSSGHLEFNAVCALAALGQFDKALALARSIVRQGYSLKWRFDLEYAPKMAWTQEMRQNEWLGPLSKTDAYQRFLKEEIIDEVFPVDDPSANTFCAVYDAVQTAKKQRCWLSKKLIAPGDEVVRVRRLFDHAYDGDLDVASKETFDQSGWMATRRQFEMDTVPLTALFPEPRFESSLSGMGSHVDWKTPSISAFHWDVARHPAGFDLDRAVSIIAEHAPNKIRLEWIQGSFQYVSAFESLVNDRGHADAVKFTWRLLKAGFGPDFLQRLAKLPQAKADKVFAMLAVFARTDCRRAAADHFGLPDLPAMMDLAFSERPSLQDHLDMADFAHENPRWRAGLASAMQAYALHIWSGHSWFMQGLEHFRRARGGQFLFFLIHHPEDDDILATMLEKEWLPKSVSDGMRTEYGNARPFYYRTSVLNRMLHASERLEFWLKSDWITYYCHDRKDRETLRLVERWRKANQGRPQRAKATVLNVKHFWNPTDEGLRPTASLL